MNAEAIEIASEKAVRGTAESRGCPSLNRTESFRSADR